MPVSDRAIQKQSMVKESNAIYFAKQKRKVFKMLYNSQSMDSLNRSKTKAEKLNGDLKTSMSPAKPIISNSKVPRGIKQSTVKQIAQKKLSKELRKVLSQKGMLVSTRDCL